MEKRQPIRAVIFDLGHTLWGIGSYAEIEAEAYPQIARRLAQELGGPVPDPETLQDAVRRRFIRDAVEGLQGKLEQPPTSQLMDETMREVGIVAPAALVEEVCELAFGRLTETHIVDDDTGPILVALRQRGLKLGCITNTILSEAKIREALAEQGFLDYFDSVLVSAEIGYRKPHPSLFRRALTDLGVEPEEAIFVGDRIPDDILPAQAAGMRAVLTRQYRQDEPQGGHPDHIISRLAELPAYLDTLAAHA